MMNTVIFFVLIVLAVNLYYGVRRGFVRMVLPLLTNIATLVLLSCTRKLWGEILTKWVFADLSLVAARIVVLVLLYVAAAAAVRLFIISLNIMTKLPILHFFNRLLGIAAGVVSGILCIWVFFAVIYICRDMQFGAWALLQIQESPVLLFLYENNLITYILALYEWHV